MLGLNLNSLYDLAVKPLSKKILASAGSLALVIAVFKVYQKKKRELKRLSYPRDVVILHQFPRGVFAPSASAFVLKVETWLRMNDIKYQNEHSYNMGPKGKLPYITYNGEDVADSDFIIQYLSEKLDKDLSKNHSTSSLGVARAFSKMADESLFWVMALNRFIHERDPASSGVPMLILLYIASFLGPRSKAQGYGLHSREELNSIGIKDLKSLNDFLAGKKYLLGDEPCNEDACIFGHVCQIIYHEKGTLHKYLTSECPNIVSYAENIKATFWPDWNQRIRRTKNNKK